MVFAFCLLKIDFGKMREHEYIAKTTGDLYAGTTDLPSEDASDVIAKIEELDEAIKKLGK